MVAQLLFIEEDYASMKYYFLELKEEGLTYYHARGTDDAMKAVEAYGAEYKLIILDSAMPHGKRYSSEQTEAGTATGGLLFRDIRKLLPNVPIIILTNFNRLDWIQKAEQESNVIVLKKLDTLPSEFVLKVKGMTGKQARS